MCFFVYACINIIKNFTVINCKTFTFHNLRIFYKSIDNYSLYGIIFMALGGIYMNLKFTKKSSIIKILKKIGLSIVVTIVFFIMIGFIYETVSYKNVNKKFPPPGQMMNINGTNLHVNVMGTLKDDSFPVIIETGTGNFSYDWTQVQKELSKYTLTVTYDRPGNGWSEPTSRKYSVDSSLEDIKTIIDKVGSNKPFIIIGHSAGGIYARLFAQKYPSYIAGMILVDSRSEYFANNLVEFNKKFFETQSQFTMKILSKLGVVRLIGKNFLPMNMPSEISKTEYVNVHWDYDFFDSVEKEIQQIPEAEKLLTPTKSLGSMPLTVITPADEHIAVVPLGFSKDDELLVNKTWKDSQKWLSTLSSNSEYILAPGESHAIMYDNPELIVTSVQDMINKLKK